MSSQYIIIKEKITKEIASAIDKCTYGSLYTKSDIERSIELSKRLGDLSCSIAFRIAKSINKSAQQVAFDISSKISLDYIQKITTENGFINIYLKRELFAKQVMGQIIKQGVTTQNLVDGTTVIIEYPSANPVHPLHAGHLRNFIIGDCIANIYQANGYAVEREDYINDLGLQAAQVLWGYLNDNNRNKDSKKYDHFLGEIYVHVNSKIKDDSSIKDKVADTLKKMESSATQEAKTSREISEKCVAAQYQTRFAYNTYHDLLVWESDIVMEKLLKKTIDLLIGNGSVKKISDGEYKDCVVIDLGLIPLPKQLEGSKEKFKVLIRSDGTATYLAKDIAFHLWKLGLIDMDFKYSTFIDKQPNENILYTTSATSHSSHVRKKAELAINIIDYRQDQQQMLLRLCLSAIAGEEIANKVKHLSYGLVSLESGALSGRMGSWIGYTADDIIDEAVNRAKQKIGERFKLDNIERDKIAHAIALSAIKFDMLRSSSEKNIVFSWNRAMNFEGDSGPYCQYMYARASRIIEESGIDKEKLDSFSADRISDDTSFDLVKKVSVIAEVVEKAGVELKPNIIVEYTVDLAYCFGRFYESVPVIKSEKEDKLARLALVCAFRATMAYALKILGIQCVERM